jgi:hypothetical protein
MKKLLHIGLLLCIATTVAAQENRKLLKTYDWKDLPQHLPNCQIISMDGMSVLKVENTNNTPLEISLLTITNAALLKSANAFALEIKYEDIGGSNNGADSGWNQGFLPPSIRFNSAVGNLEWIQKYPPAAIGGDIVTNTDWIQFVGTENWNKYGSGFRRAPYNNETTPDELEFKLYLPSIGTVYLRPIKLTKWVSPNSSNWWSPQQSGLIGGIGGSIIGCLGGLIGWLVSKGKARKFVLASTTSAIVIGILLTIAGLIAAILNQPYSVWYALLFPGVILVLVFSLNLHSIQRRYDELEIRRMTSVDTMGS